MDCHKMQLVFVLSVLIVYAPNAVYSAIVKCHSGSGSSDNLRNACLVNVDDPYAEITRVKEEVSGVNCVKNTHYGYLYYGAGQAYVWVRRFCGGTFNITTTQRSGSNWGAWSACSVSCGADGVQSRIKTCPSSRSSDCSDNDNHNKEVRNCMVEDCKTPVVTWSVYGAWSACSASCGGGSQQRIRTCSTGNNIDCSSRTDADLELRTCSTQACPETTYSNLCKNVEDQALYLTPLLDNNQTGAARQSSLVDKRFLEDFVPESHAGYFTVDRTLGSHMFFWFFPATVIKNRAPLVLWLNGGPTISSMLGLFQENGPLEIDRNSTTGRPRYDKRDDAPWTHSFSMLYVDNPVNIGYSYSEKGDSYTEENISQNLLSTLQQFLLVFPEYNDREMYIGGQGYAGMYIISLAHHIHTQFQLGLSNTKLTGIYLGGPHFDPQNQLIKHSEFLYHLGTISHKEYKNNEKAIENIFSTDSSSPQGGNMSLMELFEVVFINGTQDNFVTQEPPPYSLVEALMNTRDIKRAVHVGIRRRFRIFNQRVRVKFTKDYLISRRDKLVVILNNYKVLIYNGNLDTIISTAMIDSSLLQTPWKLQEEYKNANNRPWGEVYHPKGYYSHTGQFCRVIICGAGRQTPYDQSRRTLRMMEDFVRYGCINPDGDDFNETF